MKVGVDTPLSLIWVEYQVLGLDLGYFGMGLENP